MIKTYKAIKEALGRRLKPPLTEAEHRDLDASREIDRLGSGQLSIDGLAETIKNKRLAYGVTPLREVTVKQRGGQPVELRQRALADVVSADAADFESVRTFRRDFLSSGLLSPDDIESWVQAQC